MENLPGDASGPSPGYEPSAPSAPPGRTPTAPAKPDLGSGSQRAGPGAASEALALLTSFGRRVLVLVPVYLAGAVGLSVGFLLFGLALYLGWRWVRDQKERSLRVARQLLDDEERLTDQTLCLSQRELPAWVRDALELHAAYSPAPQGRGSPSPHQLAPGTDPDPLPPACPARTRCCRANGHPDPYPSPQPGLVPLSSGRSKALRVSAARRRRLRPPDCGRCVLGWDLDPSCRPFPALKAPMSSLWPQDGAVIRPLPYGHRGRTPQALALGCDGAR